MRRRYEPDRPLNPLEVIIAKRKERLRLVAACRSGLLPWSEYSDFMDRAWPGWRERHESFFGAPWQPPAVETNNN
ncbi:MAG: hypothetical protein ABI658_26495 [Acidimicrobiales bacterium]